MPIIATHARMVGRVEEDLRTLIDAPE